MSPKGKSVKKGKSKSPATKEMGYTIKHTFKFVTVYEYISPKNPNKKWWVIENNIYANVKVLVHVKTPVRGMSWEQGKDGDEDVDIRSYYPQTTYSLEKVLGLAEARNREFDRDWKKLQKFKRTSSG